jgi:cell division protein FtsZ
MSVEKDLLSNRSGPRILVLGVGGAGGNAVNNMIRAELQGVDFVVANTDSQALQLSLCERRVQLGREVTRGLGAGSRPDLGRAAAEECLEEVIGYLSAANMLFLTAGMGGGTGTGAAPVIAQAAREAGVLTVGVVTKPFEFEGRQRMRLAEEGIEELSQYVDTLIVIPNQNLFLIANEKTTFADAFKMADDVLHAGVGGVTDLMVMPGLINLDFMDVRSVMSEMGKAMMGTGEAEGQNRAIAAAEAAISNPLLDEVSMKGARGVLINITGGMDLTLFEVDQAANRIREEVEEEANIIFGSTLNPALEGRMRVSVVATGIEVQEEGRVRPVPLSLVVSRLGGAKRRAGEGAPQAADGGASEAAPEEQAEIAPDRETDRAEPDMPPVPLASIYASDEAEEEGGDDAPKSGPEGFPDIPSFLRQ